MLGGAQQVESEPVFVLEPYKLQVRCWLVRVNLDFPTTSGIWVDTQPACDLLIRQIGDGWGLNPPASYT